MTKPRQFLPDSTYFITRRTTRREFWLKPTKQTTRIFLYCIAMAAQKTGIKLHAACVMSTHWHAIVSDSDTHVAQFYAWVHKYVAKAVNCARGRKENLWSSEKVSVIPLESPEDVLDKTVYTLCNPVSAHLVARGENWSGVWLYRQSHSQIVKRPDVYFADEGTMPEEVVLTIHQPCSHANMSAAAYETLIAETIAHEENQIGETMKKTGQKFMGMDTVLQQSHGDRPGTQEVRRGMNPRFAAKDKALRISAIRRYKQFVSDYSKALKAWRNGNRGVEFPPGTYAMRIYAGVTVSPG